MFAAGISQQITQLEAGQFYKIAYSEIITLPTFISFCYINVLNLGEAYEILRSYCEHLNI